MIYLLIAIACEIVATSLLPSTNGFRVPTPTAVVVTGYIAAFALLSQAVRTVPVSTAYAMWSGIGTAIVAFIGFTILGEEASLARVAGIVFIIAGVILLNAGTAAEA